MELELAELIIFDWSGTVSDDRRPTYEADKRVLNAYDKPIMPFESCMQTATMDAADFYMACGIPGSRDELNALFKKHFDDVVRSGIVPKPYPDACEVLMHLRDNGKLLAVLSSHPQENLIKEATNYGLMDCLDLISGSSKNKVQGLRTICDELGNKPKYSLYVGDLIYDIRSAKAAGLPSAAVCRGYHSKEMLERESPDFLLECLSELKIVI